MTNEEVKSEKVKKEGTMAGIIFGVFLAQAFGGGIIPLILGILFGIYLQRKMLSSDKSYIKIMFWVLFVIMFIVALVVLAANRSYGV